MGEGKGMRRRATGKTNLADAGRCVVTDPRELFADALAAALRLHDIHAEVAAFSRADVLSTTYGKNYLAPPPVVVTGMSTHSVTTTLDIIEAVADGGAPVVVLADADVEEISLAEALQLNVMAIEESCGCVETLAGTIRDAAESDSLVPLNRRYELEDVMRRHRKALAEQMRPFQRLTGREREVLDAMMRGVRAEQIAKTSFVSLSTVRSQIRSILCKLAVHSQLEAVALANESQWSIAVESADLAAHG